MVEKLTASSLDTLKSGRVTSRYSSSNHNENRSNILKRRRRKNRPYSEWKDVMNLAGKGYTYYLFVTYMQHLCE